MKIEEVLTSLKQKVSVLFDATKIDGSNLTIKQTYECELGEFINLRSESWKNIDCDFVNRNSEAIFFISDIDVKSIIPAYFMCALILPANRKIVHTMQFYLSNRFSFSGKECKPDAYLYLYDIYNVEQIRLMVDIYIYLTDKIR